MTTYSHLSEHLSAFEVFTLLGLLSEASNALAITGYMAHSRQIDMANQIDDTLANLARQYEGATVPKTTIPLDAVARAIKGALVEYHSKRDRPAIWYESRNDARKDIAEWIVATAITHPTARAEFLAACGISPV